jgi:hypothetical protein
MLAFVLQCAMCYQSASQQGAKGMAALNAGILVLLIPPVAILGCISWITWRRSGKPTTTDAGERSSGPASG